MLSKPQFLREIQIFTCGYSSSWCALVHLGKVPTLTFFCEIGEMDRDFEKELLEEECEGDGKGCEGEFWCEMTGGP